MAFLTQQQLVNSGDIKREAKAQLSGQWQTIILLCIIPIILSLGNYGVQVTTNLENYQQVATGSVPESMAQHGPFQAYISVGTGVGLVLQLVLGLITMGIIYTLIDYIRYRCSIQPIKDSLRVLTGDYVWSLGGLWLLRQLYLFLWTLLLIVPGIIKRYAYAQAFNIYRDARNEGYEMGLNEAIAESSRMMKGHKFRLFMLDISFIGWGILTLLFFGLPIIGVMPYYNMSRAVFYENISKEFLATHYTPTNQISEQH